MAQSTSTDIRHAIGAANRDFMAALSRGDIASAAAAYTEQGVVLPPNSEVVAGKQAIQTFWQGAINMGIKTVTLETNEMEGYGDTAHEVGRYTLQGDSGQVIDIGKYVVIWKHEAGQWKIHRDIWNSSRPAAGK